MQRSFVTPRDWTTVDRRLARNGRLISLSVTICRSPQSRPGGACHCRPLSVCEIPVPVCGVPPELPVTRESPEPTARRVVTSRGSSPLSLSLRPELGRPA